MLKSAPTLAIGGVDTAENGPSKVRQVTNKIRRNVGLLHGSRARRRPPFCVRADLQKKKSEQKWTFHGYSFEVSDCVKLVFCGLFFSCSGAEIFARHIFNGRMYTTEEAAYFDRLH